MIVMPTLAARRRLGWMALPLAALIASCGASRDREAITDIRLGSSQTAPNPPAKMSSAERLGLRTPESSPRPLIPANTAPAGFDPASLQWTTPAGWNREPDRPMRLATFTTAGGAVECYVIVLAGSAGGVAANINRWRQQMGQSALSPEEIAGLPKLQVLGQEAPLVTITGDYAGMSGEIKTGQTLMGTVCPWGDQTVFVKMIGPEAAVTAEAGAFTAFCESLKTAAE